MRPFRPPALAGHAGRTPPAAPLAAALAIALGAGCSLTPTVPADAARTVGAGRTIAAAYAMPEIGATVAHGLTDRLDLGASAELRGTVALWTRYAVADAPGFALALEARAFAGFVDEVAHARGASVGPLIELGAGPRRLLAGLRYNALEHETYADRGGLYDGLFELGLRPEPGEDYGRIGQLWATLALDLSSRGALHLGATCDFYLSLERDPDRYGDRPDRERCYPVLGLSLPVGG